MSDEPRDRADDGIGAGSGPSTNPIDGATDPPSDLAEPRLEAAPDVHPHRGWLIAGRTLIAALAVLVLLGTGLEWTIKARADAGLQDRKIQSVLTDDSNIVTPTQTPAQSDKTYAAENILLLGSDSRAGANGNASNNDGSIDTSVSQSDTLMVAHVSADREHVTVVSIPRDLQVDAPQCKQWSNGVVSDTEQPITEGEQWKITNAYAVGGPACTVRAVQQLTGLRIDRVIGIDFSGFKAMVDAVGGIQVNICKPIVDAELNTVIPTAGEQIVTGDKALDLVRARKVKGDPTGDLGRIRRQQVVLSALLRQVTSAGTLLNPSTLNSFLQAFVQSTYTDNVTIDDLVALAQSFGTLDPAKITFYTLPTHISESDPDALALDTETAHAVFQAMIEDLPLPGQPRAATSSAASTTSARTPPTPTAPTPGSAPSSGSVAPGSLSATELSAINAGTELCA